MSETRHHVLMSPEKYENGKFTSSDGAANHVETCFDTKGPRSHRDYQPSYSQASNEFINIMKANLPRRLLLGFALCCELSWLPRWRLTLHGE